MKNEYLWDGSGEPDPELQQLEESLAQFRYSIEMPNFPALPATVERLSFFDSLRVGWMPRIAAATLVVAGLLASGFFSRLTSPPAETGAGWDVARLAGAPKVGQVSLASDSKAQLKAGQVLVTGSDSRASLNLADVGEIYVDPGSRVRVVQTGSNRERLSLELGTIHAAIWAPPGQFVVDTPSATAIDLGCAYTLQVNDDGSGMLRTTLGWVGFHKDGHDSFIPAGAMAMTRPVQGPGTPFFEDAPEKLRDALRMFDFDGDSPEAREKALHIVLAEARPRDAFTLWHLLFRVNDEQRTRVYERMSSMVAPPAGVTREGALTLDPQTTDAWWNAFDLGDISVWRYWEQQQVPTAMKKAAR